MSSCRADFHGPAAADRAGGRARQLDRPAAGGFALSPSTAIKLMQRVRATGSAAPALYRGHRRPLFTLYEAELRRLVEASPDLSLAELQHESSAASASSPLGERPGPLPTLQQLLERMIPILASLSTRPPFQVPWNGSRTGQITRYLARPTHVLPTPSREGP